MKTLQTRYADALLSLGFVEQQRTARYRVFRGYNAALFLRPSGHMGVRYYYLGKNGALRWTDSGKVTLSRPCSPKTAERLLSLLPKRTPADTLLDAVFKGYDL